ncbi:MAG TPA: protein-L-isoaspartate(D-aspartate) O-methyltransferase [Thiothrix sp.]|nr:protein-L-isoaspartate(D-aspartate) O-methyltransferase [Thiothrix sp.]
MTHYSEQDIAGRGMTSQRTRDRLVKQLQQMGLYAAPVLEMMRRVPRHLFVDEALASRAYENISLPIGYGQTISQPYIVAKMTSLLLQLKQGHPHYTNRQIPQQLLNNVLEVGTGSGYQASILGGLVRQLHTVERIPALHQQAQQLLLGLGYRNIHCHCSDGSWGWQAAAPYDAIIVTAAPKQLPDELLTQLAIGGCLVSPVGVYGQQQLQQIIRYAENDYRMVQYEPVQFVPFIVAKS